MDGNSERENREAQWRRGVDDGEERSVGGSTWWKTKGSEDERNAGESERGGCSLCEVFTHVDAVIEANLKPQRCKRG